MAAYRRRLPVSACAAVLAASFAIVTPGAHAATPCPGADLIPTVASPAAAKVATLCLLNAERAARGLAPLTSQPELEVAAANYSQAMVVHRFFAHASPSGESLQQRLTSYIRGVQTWDIGENLAWGEGSYATPAGVVGGWMRSDAHRANVLKATFREIGIGIVPGTPVGSPPEASATYTTEFGTRVVPGSDPVAATGPGAGANVQGASASNPASPVAGKVSAARKRSIKAKCARIAKRTKGSRSARRARAARCVRTRVKAAGRS